jgi:hypothetical protein
VHLFPQRRALDVAGGDARNGRFSLKTPQVAFADAAAADDQHRKFSHDASPSGFVLACIVYNSISSLS